MRYWRPREICRGFVARTDTSVACRYAWLLFASSWPPGLVVATKPSPRFTGTACLDLRRVSVRHLVLASPDGSCATTATDNIYRCNTHSTSPRQRLSGYISVHVLTQSPQECLCDDIPLLRHLHNSASAKISRQERVRARDLCVCVSSPARVFLRYTAAASTGFA